MMGIISGAITWMMSGAIANLLVGGGITLVIATGLDLLITEFLDDAAAMMGGMPADILNLSLLFGWGEALSILGGALLTRVAIATAANVMGMRVAK